MQITTRTIATNSNHLATPREIDAVRPGVLYNDNVSPAGGGETNYGKVKPGTVLSKDSNGQIHPCGWQVAQALGSGVNVMTVEDGLNFYVGDLVEIRSVAGVVDSVTIAAGDNPSNLGISATAVGDSGIKVALVDPAGNSQPLTYSIADSSGDTLINISLATDGAGAITTTVAELAAFIDANTLAMGIVSGTQETAADVCQAVAATALTGGVAKDAAIVSARAVTASTATTVTWDGAVSTFAAGDYLLKTGAHRPYGIMEREVSTVRYVDSTLVTESRDIDVRYAGDLRTAQIIGLSSALKQALSGGAYPDPQDSTSLVQPATEGFVFMAV